MNLHCNLVIVDDVSQNLWGVQIVIRHIFFHFLEELLENMSLVKLMMIFILQYGYMPP